jgi:hypothetical protein
VTSASAFAANAVSAIPALASFGAFTACVILAYFSLLFLLVFPTLSFWWRWIEPVERTVAWCVCWPVTTFARNVLGCRDTRVTTDKHVVINPTYVDAAAVDVPSLRGADVHGGHDDDGDVPMIALNDVSRDIREEDDDTALLVLNSNDDDDAADDGMPLFSNATTAGLAAGNDNNNTTSNNKTTTTTKSDDDDDNSSTSTTNDDNDNNTQQPYNDHQLRRAGVTEDGGGAIVRRGVPTLLERLLYDVAAPVVIQRRRTVLVLFFIYVIASVVSATRLEFAQEAPSLVRKDSVPGRVAALADEFPGWNADGGTIPAPTPPPPPTTPSRWTTTLPPPTTTRTTVSPSGQHATTPWPTLSPDKIPTVNNEIDIVMGFAPPYVDTSRADVTAFTQSFDDYDAVFDLSFNTNQSNYTRPNGLGFEVGSAWHAACTSLLANTQGLVSVPADTTQDDLCACASCVGAFKAINCSLTEAQRVTATNLAALYTTSSFTATFTTNAGSQVIMNHYRSLKKALSTAREIRPELATIDLTSAMYVRASFELAAIYGSIWGIVLSLALCILAIVVFKPHGTVIGITVGLVVANLFAVLASFQWSGWKLGGIEAVALSILVGTSVDYFIHMTEAFLHASPDASQAGGLRGRPLCDAVALRGSSDARAIREWRARVAMATVGVPITWSAITTAGSAAILMSCNLVLFRRLGEILVFNTLISWTFTMTALPAMLSSVGPAGFAWSRTRCAKAVLVLVLTAGLGTLALYLAWKAHPDAIRNSRADPLFG